MQINDLLRKRSAVHAQASDSCGDTWLSTEDIFSISSPCYFSAIEDDDDDDADATPVQQKKGVAVVTFCYGHSYHG